MKRVATLAGILVGAAGLYLSAWPVDVEPVVFEVPPPAEPFARDEKLGALEILDLGENVGPEDVAVNAAGEAFAATLDGDIVRYSADRRLLGTYVNTGGRPLGLVFDRAGDLLVADAYRGILRVRADRSLAVLVPGKGAGQIASDGDELANTNVGADAESLCYANYIDVAPDGTIYFTDSSARFCPYERGGTFAASLLDIFEHRGTGRLLAYDPRTRKTRVLVDGLQFANGVAISPDGEYALLVETGACRVLRYRLRGAEAGQLETLVEGMPGYPDNITRGADGRYWIGFTRPRSKILEALADRPFVRKMILRLPRSLLPVPPAYGHIIALDIDGNTVRRLQDAEPEYPDTTGATETAEGLYIHSLHARGLGWLPKGAY
jgi:sugar lactone lactonase YvrE